MNANNQTPDLQTFDHQTFDNQALEYQTLGYQTPLDSMNPALVGSLALNDTALDTLQSDGLQLRCLAGAEYLATHQAMLERTLERFAAKRAGVYTADELWLVEHQDIYTLGQAGKEEHILYHTETPIIKTDRGGQVTWHGAGQLVAYFLFDLNALGMSVRDLVSHAEQAIEDVVNAYLPDTLTAKARRDAPGVYVYDVYGQMLGKIASLGFKIKHGFSYHGVAINLINDTKPFMAINPCGYAGMQMVRLAGFGKFDQSDVPTFIQRFVTNVKKRQAHQITLR